MFKKFGVIFLAIIMLISASGCDSNNGDTSSKKEKPNSSSSGIVDKNNSSDITSTTDDKSESSKSNTVTTVVPKKERPTTEVASMKKEYTLEGDTTIKDELKFGKYKYVWGDEFNGKTLDMNKWCLEDDLNDLWDVKTDYPVEMKDGCLNLIAKRYYDPNNDSIKFAQSIHVTTQNTMNFQHGYLEFRAKVPLKKGMWPSVWFKDVGCGLIDAEKIAESQNRPYHIECNVFEVHGDLDLLKPNIHKWYGPNNRAQAARIRTNYTFDDTTFLPEEYHVYGLLWTEEEISMFVDGEKYNTFDLSYNLDSKSDMSGFTDSFWYMRLENDIISAANTGADAISAERMDEYEPGDLPAVFSFDWIRLYQCYDGTDSQIITKK